MGILQSRAFHISEEDTQVSYLELIKLPHYRPRGGYTSFLLGVDQAATLQAAAKKLNFD